MALGDILGSLGRAASEELPGIMQRVEARSLKKKNADFYSAFNAALNEEDEDKMEDLISVAAASGISAPGINAAQSTLQKFRDKTFEKKRAQLESDVAVAGNSSAGVGARFELWKYGNQDASEEHKEAVYNSLRAQHHQAQMMDRLAAMRQFDPTESIAQIGGDIPESPTYQQYVQGSAVIDPQGLPAATGYGQVDPNTMYQSGTTPTTGVGGFGQVAGGPTTQPPTGVSQADPSQEEPEGIVITPPAAVKGDLIRRKEQNQALAKFFEDRQKAFEGRKVTGDQALQQLANYHTAHGIPLSEAQSKLYESALRGGEIGRIVEGLGEEAKKKRDGELKLQATGRKIMELMSDPTQNMRERFGPISGNITIALNHFTKGKASKMLEWPPGIEDLLFYFGVAQDDISRMQSGAALTPDEQDFYADILRNALNNDFDAAKNRAKLLVENMSKRRYLSVMNKLQGDYAGNVPQHLIDKLYKESIWVLGGPEQQKKYDLTELQTGFGAMPTTSYTEQNEEDKALVEGLNINLKDPAALARAIEEGKRQLGITTGQ